MLDSTFIRDNLDLCKQAAKNKNRVVDWDGFVALDSKRRQLIGQSETLRARRNIVSKTITEESKKEGKDIKEKLKVIEEELRDVEGKLQTIVLTIPNVPHESVPVGKDEHDNVELRRWGKPTEFSFSPKDHIELAKHHDLIDFERGAKVSGFRGYFLKNEAAQLELAVLFFTFTHLIKKGYTPLIAPALVREFTLFGNGQFPWGKDEVYVLPKDDQYLAGTAEVPVTAYHSGEILSEKDLPKKFVAFSPCFRREAGSYGKDTKGIYRIHQFNKIEQVILAKNDTDSSLSLLEELLGNSEEILQALGLPYRVLLMCTGDMGEPQVKKFDIETWMPGRNAYGETMSDSFMGDFQSRRLNIRYRSTDGSVKFVHTLNNTAIASPRILIPILENYQQEDGSIRIPDALVPFMGKSKIG